ncbi:MAG: hypothetical protein HeimC3_49460 [Candidatus Heimdallarchaeota archaeon LC_3]|nr:MAG: hypothetical protein HeimC3_49460 [Candidatus Heimdallarchaeota archaeon LC_3]
MLSRITETTIDIFKHVLSVMKEKEKFTRSEIGRELALNFKKKWVHENAYKIYGGSVLTFLCESELCSKDKIYYSLSNTKYFIPQVEENKEKILDISEKITPTSDISEIVEYEVINHNQPQNKNQKVNLNFVDNGLNIELILPENFKNNLKLVFQTSDAYSNNDNFKFETHIPSALLKSNRIMIVIKKSNRNVIFSIIKKILFCSLIII